MQFIGIIKRVIPFFLTFAAGLFIASFFVSLSAPRFEGMKQNRSERWGKHNRLKAENEELRRENRELKREVEGLRDFTQVLEIPPPVNETNGIDCTLETGPDIYRVTPPSAPVKEMKMKTVTVK